MELDVIPEVLDTASARVGTLTARLAGANLAHMAVAGVVLPPAADPVSLKTGVALSAESTAHEAMAMGSTEELARSAEGIAESSASYRAGEFIAAAANEAAAL